MTRLTEWLNADSARSDVAARFERMRRDFDLPSLSSFAERFHTEAEWPSLSSFLERVQADAAWPRLTRWLDRAQSDVEFPRLADLVEKWQREVEFPDMPVSLSTQQRQVLRGVLLLGMALHAGPTPLTKVTPPFSGGGSAITETRGGDLPLAARAAGDGRYVLADATETASDEAVAPDTRTAPHAAHVVAPRAWAADSSPAERFTLPDAPARAPIAARCAQGPRAPPALVLI